MPAGWRDPALGERWERVREVRRVVTGALELERKEKRIGASLQAAPVVYLGEADRRCWPGSIWPSSRSPAASSCATARRPAGAFALEDVPGVAVVPALAEGEKCARCWQVLPEVAASPEQLCRRCTDAVARCGRPEARACAGGIDRPAPGAGRAGRSTRRPSGWLCSLARPLPAGRGDAVLQPGPGLEPRRQLRHARRRRATTGPGCSPRWPRRSAPSSSSGCSARPGRSPRLGPVAGARRCGRQRDRPAALRRGGRLPRLPCLRLSLAGVQRGRQRDRASAPA